MQYLVNVALTAALILGGLYWNIPGLAQGGGSRTLQPSDPCLIIPTPPECDSTPDSEATEEPVEVEPLPAPEPAPAPEIVQEEAESPEPALTETEEEQVEESTITPLYDEDEEGEAELEREVDQSAYTDNRVGVGLAKLLTIIYLAFTGLGLVVSGVVALVTYFVRRKNGGNTEANFLRVPLVFACLVVLGGLVYAFLNTL